MAHMLVNKKTRNTFWWFPLGQGAISGMPTCRRSGRSLAMCFEKARRGNLRVYSKLACPMASGMFSGSCCDRHPRSPSCFTWHQAFLNLFFDVTLFWRGFPLKTDGIDRRAQRFLAARGAASWGFCTWTSSASV